MPRRLLGIFILLLVSVSSMQAQGDVALFTVGTDTIGLKEFEYHFSASSERNVHVFSQTYLRFKQKVLWAKELRLDTLKTYLRQKEQFRRARSNQVSAQWDKRYSSKGGEWIKVIHFTRPLSQRASKEEEQQAMVYMDSLYASLNVKENVKFEEFPWIQTRFLLNEWQEQLDDLDKGTYSKPFCSPLGVHIVAWTGRLVMEENGNTSLPGYECIRAKEVEEALLVASLERHLEERISCSGAELDRYFRVHKEKYGWGTPHYKGAVIHCQDKKEAKRIKKYLKNFPMELWQDAWKRIPADVSSGCLVETGLFAIGVNPYIDQLVFKCGEFQSKQDYPYTWVLGKKMKKGPSSYKDVLEKVEKDCRKAKKEAEMEAFLQKYQVEINEEVLKTVNRCGNK